MLYFFGRHILTNLTLLPTIKLTGLACKFTFILANHVDLALSNYFMSDIV